MGTRGRKRRRAHEFSAASSGYVGLASGCSCVFHFNALRVVPLPPFETAQLRVSSLLQGRYLPKESKGLNSDRTESTAPYVQAEVTSGPCMEGANMIAVTGATGHLGCLVVEQLLQRVPASQLVAVVRDAAKAADFAARGVAVRIANYDEPATLETAFVGVDKLLLISGSELGKRIPQHRAAIAAAKNAGVKLLAYTSLLRANTARMSLSVEHVATEKALRESGLPFVLLRNGWYLENYTENLGSALQHGVILGAAQHGRIAAAARADYAEAAAAVITSDGHAGQVYELAGDAAFTLTELAAEVSKQSGKAIVYKNLSAPDYAATLQSFGVPSPVAEMLASADEGIARDELDVAGSDLRRLIGRPTTALATSVAAALGRG
jgi:NAD(P)H dehydrogenase (quinone)